MQKEVSQREKCPNETRHDFQMTDSQLQACLVSVAEKPEQLQQLDEQPSVVGTSGTVAVLHLLHVFNLFFIR